MASFGTKTFMKNDDYMTPKSAWENISHLIPKDKIIWEPFFGNGDSGNFLREFGFEVIHNDEDFYQHNHGDIIITNPPFSDIPNILIRLKELGKPFVMIMPVSKINTGYFRRLFCNTLEPIQLIIPRKRIQFIKLVDGLVPNGYKSDCNFDCFYYCWKMNLNRDIIWLE